MADRDVADPMPPLIRHLFRSECPVCGEKWLASVWDTLRYSLHYATVHLGLSPWRQL